MHVAILVLILANFCSGVLSQKLRPNCPLSRIERIIWTDERFLIITIKEQANNPLICNISFEVVKLMQKPMATMDLSLQGTKRNINVLNLNVSICKLFGGNSHDFILRKYFGLNRATTTLPKTCPIPVGHYRQDNAKIPIDAYSAFFSGGTAHFKMTISGVYEGENYLVAKININFNLKPTASGNNKSC